MLMDRQRKFAWLGTVDALSIIPPAKLVPSQYGHNYLDEFD